MRHMRRTDTGDTVERTDIVNAQQLMGHRNPMSAGVRLSLEGES